jgi:hypothetical protein
MVPLGTIPARPIDEAPGIQAAPFSSWSMPCSGAATTCSPALWQCCARCFWTFAGHTWPRPPGSSSVLVNTKGSSARHALGSARIRPAGGSSNTFYPSIPLQWPGASASSPPTSPQMTKSRPPVTVARRITPPTAVPERRVPVSVPSAPPGSAACHADRPGGPLPGPGAAPQGRVHGRRGGCERGRPVAARGWGQPPAGHQVGRTAHRRHSARPVG